MMVTYFLASVMGWYLLIMGLLLLFRRDIVTSAMSDVMAQRGLLFVIAFITLIIGLMIVVSHNIWVMGWPVIITILGWLAVISGLIRLYCPETIHRMWDKMATKPEIFSIAGVLILLLGLFLLYKVYF